MGEIGAAGVGPKRLRLKRLRRLNLLRNSGPAAPRVLTSPLGPIFGLRLVQGGTALVGEEELTFMGFTVSFHPQYLRLPGPHWSCLFSFVASQCGQEGPGGPGLDLVCQRLGR